MTEPLELLTNLGVAGAFIYFLRDQLNTSNEFIRTTIARNTETLIKLEKTISRLAK